MQLEIIIKVIGVVLTILGGSKILHDINIGGRSRLREEYKFVRDFFVDLKNNPDMSPFERDKGYQAIVGIRNISSEEVSYLISLKNPTKCLNDYLFSRKYLQTIEPSGDCGDIRLIFSDKWSSPQKRKWIKSICFTLYWLLAITAFLPIFLPQRFSGLLIMTVPTFGYYAFLALDTHMRIDRSEKLVNNQQRNTSSIHIASGSNYLIKK